MANIKEIEAAVVEFFEDYVGEVES